MSDAIDAKIEMLIDRISQLDNALSVRIYVQGALTTAVGVEARDEIGVLFTKLPDAAARARIKELMRPGVTL